MHPVYFAYQLVLKVVLQSIACAPKHLRPKGNPAVVDGRMVVQLSLRME